MAMLDTLHRVALWVAILLLAGWGLGLVFVPNLVHPLGSPDPINPATTGTLGAALIALAVIFLFMAVKRGVAPTLEAAIALAILSLMRAYLMFVTGALHVNAPMLITLLVAVGTAVILFVGARGEKVTE